MNIHEFILSKKKSQKLFAVLIDPDKQTNSELLELIDLSVRANVDLFFVGGSLLTTDSMNECVSAIKTNCNIPVVIFLEILCRSTIMQIPFFSCH